VSTGCRNIVIAMTATVALMVSAGPALGAPRVVSAGFDRATVVGRDLNLSVRAVDPGRPVSGMTVSFGNPPQVFALSACRPAGSDGRAPGGPFAPGAPVTLRAPHRFARAGAQQVVARLDSGGCDAGGETLYQPLTAILTRPGEPPVPPVLGLPVTRPGLLPKVPGLPSAIELPGLPVLATVAEAEIARAAAARCPGAGARIRGDAKSLRAARAALLCTMNAVRRRVGLRPLRANGRLRRAATAHSSSMVARRYFSHTAPSGGVLTSRMRRVRYLPARRWFVGENLATGKGRAGSPRSIVRAWLRSPPHRANLLERGFREVGIGLVPGQPGRSRKRGVTWTANFGYRR
jgi:uncharacterized protein YkwD